METYNRTAELKEVLIKRIFKNVKDDILTHREQKAFWKWYNKKKESSVHPSGRAKSALKKLADKFPDEFRDMF